MTESTKSGSDQPKPDKSDALKLEKQKCKVLKIALKEEKQRQKQTEDDLKATLEKCQTFQVKLMDKVNNISLTLCL